MNRMPTLGVALPLAGLRAHRDWILEDQRDLEMQDFYRQEVLDGDWRSIAREIRSLLDGYSGRLGIHGPFWGLALDNPDAMVRAAVRRRFQQGLDVAEELGATHMVLHSPITPWEYRHVRASAKKVLFDLVQETLCELLERSERIGCTLVIENIQDIDPALQLELVRSLNSPAARVSVDVGHAFCMHTMDSAPPPDYFVGVAGADLEHLHLQDTDGYFDRHWLPGEGKVQWNALFETLRGLDHRPRLILEVEDTTRVRLAAQWLEDRGFAR